MLVKLSKDGRDRLVDEEIAHRYLSQGYTQTPPEPEGPVMQEDSRRVAVVELVEVTKGKRVRLVLPDTVPAMLERGYKLKGGDDGEKRDESGLPVEGSRDDSGGAGRGEAGVSEGDGAGSGAQADAPDERPEGREDLKPAVKVPPHRVGK